MGDDAELGLQIGVILADLKAVIGGQVRIEAAAAGTRIAAAAAGGEQGHGHEQCEHKG